MRCLVTSILLQITPLEANQKAGEFTPIDHIRRMSVEQAAQGLPVRISGTCIYLANGEMVVHDGQHGIWVSSNLAKSRNLLNDGSALSSIKVGHALEIDGFTDPGGFARQVLPAFIRIRGDGIMPPPVRISAEQLVACSEDGQRVELIGVVQDVQVLEDRTVCSVMAEGVTCWVALHGNAATNLPPLVDARVRAVGAFAPDFNNRSEAVLPKIISSSSDWLKVIQPPPANPFDSPRVALDRVRAFSPDVSLFHRKVVSGLVTFVRPGSFFYVREGDTCMRVESSDTDVRAGWKVEVAGFIDTTRHLAAFKNGIVRKIGVGDLAPPEVVAASQVMTSARWRMFEGRPPVDLSGHTVSLRGTLRKVERDSNSTTTLLLIESDEVEFPAKLPADAFVDEKLELLWQEGAQVELTGACELDFSGRPDPLGLYQPVGFQLWLSSAEDVRILRSAPWWTPRRLTIALSATGGAALLAMGGVAMLRRQVKRQVEVIARELENKAVATERERMARDLHDTLEQQLTGVAMQLEGLAKSPHPMTPDFSNRLSLASRMLQHSREEARRSVWDLRNKVLESHGFAAALESLAASAAIDGGPKVSTKITGERAHLPSPVTYQLLRMAQEALANSLKHAKAQNIWIRLEMSEGEYAIVISDDGCGFDAAMVNPSSPPHFGLMGMRERAFKIGAKLELASQPGQGATITITLPLPLS